MRSLKNQVTLLVMGIIALVTMIVILVFFLQARPILLMNTETEAKRDIAAAEAIIDLKHPGPWHTRGGILYKGQAEVNNNYFLVDYIKELTGASCSIYLNNVCVSTTEIDGDCYIRAVDQSVPKEVRSKVLEAGQIYLGQAEVEGRVSQAAYKPIINDDGQVIGVLYIGTRSSLYNSIIYGSMKTIGIAGLILAVLIALITRYFVDRKLVKSKPLREVDAEIWRSPKQELVHNSIKDNDFDMLDTLLDWQQELPKGLNPLTLKEILLFLLENDGDEVTVKDVSKSMSLSTVTVRRYLDYMEECGLVDVEQEYGSVGRPLKLYKLKG
ncbi:MAG: cache domain-containing protein [Syntrophaceticus schinkii]|jgi:methyl-accepting chemotaxis protein|nr:cache domain-containing protein [Syntrophaceticus schinkii]